MGVVRLLKTDICLVFIIAVKIELKMSGLRIDNFIGH